MTTKFFNIISKRGYFVALSLAALSVSAISEDSFAAQTSHEAKRAAPAHAQSHTVSPAHVHVDKSGFFASAHYRIGFNGSGDFKDFAEDASGVKSASALTPSKGVTGFDKYKMSFINGAVEVGYQLNDSFRFGVEGVYNKLSPDYESTDPVSYFELVREAKFADAGKDAITYTPATPAGTGGTPPAVPEKYELTTGTGPKNPVLVSDLAAHPGFNAALAAGASMADVACAGTGCPTTKAQYYSSANLAFKFHDPEIVSYGALASARYDMHISDAFAIYAGIGAGWLRVELLEATNDTVGYQARAGMGFELMPGLKLEAGYYYLGAWNDEFKEIPTDAAFPDVVTNVASPYAKDDKSIFSAVAQPGTKTAHGKLRYGVHGVELGASFSFNS